MSDEVFLETLEVINPLVLVRIWCILGLWCSPRLSSAFRGVCFAAENKRTGDIPAAPPGRLLGVIDL
jgi:hypothetical protein